MKIKNLLLCSLMTLFVIGMSSCSDDSSTNGGPGNPNGEGPGTAPDPFPGADETFIVSFDNEPIDETLDLSFQSKSPESYGIFVESTEPWTVSAGDNSWLDIEVTNDGFSLTAERNRIVAAREGLVTITSGNITKTIKASQAKPRIVVYNVGVMDVNGTPGLAVSANGRYVVGGNSSMKWICDLDQQTPDLSGSEEVVVVDLDGSTIVTGPAGIEGYSHTSSISNYGVAHHRGQTPDGSIFVDGITIGGYTNPVYTKKGFSYDLPAPTEVQIGTLGPHKGYYAERISDDGKYIVGIHRTLRGGYVECGWKYNEASGSYDYIIYPELVELTEYDETATLPQTTADWNKQSPRPYAISRNGKWTAGNMHVLMTNPGQYGNYAYWRDIETGKINIITSMGAYRQPTVITNQGLVGVGGAGVYSTTFFDINSGENVSLYNWITDIFGIENPGKYIGNYLVRSVSEDNTTVVLGYQPNQTTLGTQIITVQ